MNLHITRSSQHRCPAAYQIPQASVNYKSIFQALRSCEVLHNDVLQLSKIELLLSTWVQRNVTYDQ